MNTRLLAFVLALCLALGLAACGGPSDNPEPDVPSASPELVEPEPSVDPDGEPALAPTDEPGVDPSDEPTLAPTGTIPPDVGTSPIETKPADETSSATKGEHGHEEEPAKKDFTAADVYAMWLTTSSQFPAPAASFIDMSAYLDAYYTSLNEGDVDSFVFYQPDMSSSLQEVFIAKAKAGKVDSVKSAVQDRLNALKEEAEFYPGTSEYVDAAKVETVGNWVVLCAAPEAANLVTQLKNLK